jgi:hypothetical protein
MKPLMFVCTLILCATCTQAQTLNVPDVVKAKFSSLYPTVKSPTWEMEEGMYEASFTYSQVATTVVISAAGEHQQTETAMEPNTLPRMTRYYVMKELSNQPITEASKIMDSKGVVSYEAEVGGKDYLFDAEGNFTGMESDADETGEEKD